MATGDHGQSGSPVQSLVTMEKRQDHEIVIIPSHHIEERNVLEHQNRLKNAMVEFHVPVSVSAALYICCRISITYCEALLSSELSSASWELFFIPILVVSWTSCILKCVSLIP